MDRRNFLKKAFAGLAGVGIVTKIADADGHQKIPVRPAEPALKTESVISTAPSGVEEFGIALEKCGPNKLGWVLMRTPDKDTQYVRAATEEPVNKGDIVYGVAVTSAMPL